MSGGLPHPEDTTDDPPEMAELRLQVMSKTVLYCRLNNYLFIYFLLYLPRNKLKLQKIKEKREKNKWRGDLTETIRAYERLGLLELWVRAV